MVALGTRCSGRPRTGRRGLLVLGLCILFAALCVGTFVLLPSGAAVDTGTHATRPVRTDRGARRAATASALATPPREATPTPSIDTAAPEGAPHAVRRVLVSNAETRTVIDDARIAWRVSGRGVPMCIPRRPRGLLDLARVGAWTDATRIRDAWTVPATEALLVSVVRSGYLSEVVEVGAGVGDIVLELWGASICRVRLVDANTGLGVQGVVDASLLDRSRFYPTESKATDASGTVDVALPRPSVGGLFLRCAARGYVDGHVSIASSDDAECEVRMRRAACARVLVRDANGTPAGSASIAHDGKEIARTGEDGRAALDISGGGDSLGVVIAARSGESAVSLLRASPFEGDEVEIRLGPSVELRGQVVDPHGLGVSGATVELVCRARTDRVGLETQTMHRWTESNSGGWFVFNGLPRDVASEDAEIVASTPNQQYARLVVRSFDTMQTLHLPDRSADEPLRYRVVDTRGTQVTGAWGEATWYPTSGSDAPTDRSTLADSARLDAVAAGDGALVFVLPRGAGRWKLRIGAPGFVTRSMWADERCDDGSGGSLSLTKSTRVVGRVVGVAGDVESTPAAIEAVDLSSGAVVARGRTYAGGLFLIDVEEGAFDGSLGVRAALTNGRQINEHMRIVILAGAATSLHDERR